MQAVLPFDIRSPEVVGVKATVGRPLATLPSEKIYSPLHIHVAPELLIPQDQVTHALCVLRLQSPEILSFVFVICLFIHAGLNIKGVWIMINWGVECKSVLPVRVGHPKFFPCKRVIKGGVMAGDLRKVSVTESEVT